MRKLHCFCVDNHLLGAGSVLNVAKCCDIYKKLHHQSLGVLWGS